MASSELPIPASSVTFASPETLLKVALIVADRLGVEGVLEFFREQIKLWESWSRTYTSNRECPQYDKFGPAPLHNPVNHPLSIVDHCVRLAWVYKDMIDGIRKVRDVAPDIVPHDSAILFAHFLAGGPTESGALFRADKIPEHGLRESLAAVRAALAEQGLIPSDTQKSNAIGCSLNRAE